MPVFSSLRPVLTMLLCGLLFVNAALRAEPQVPIGQDEPQLPYLGDVSSSIISTAEEHFLGQIWLMQLRSQVTMLDDPVVNHYLENLLGQLAGSSQLQDRRLTLVVIDSPELNAFAVPGGYLYVYTGLIKYLDSEDQLAGVMGHEIAHAAQRHSTQQMTKLYGIDAIRQIITGKTDPGLLGQIALSLVSLKFSRSHEAEADQYSVIYLCETGYNASGAAGFFEKIGGKGGNPPEFLSTHPDPGNRVTAIKRKSQELGCRGKDRNIPEYDKIKKGLN